MKTLKERGTRESTDEFVTRLDTYLRALHAASERQKEVNEQERAKSLRMRTAKDSARIKPPKSRKG